MWVVVMWIWCSATGALLDMRRKCQSYGYAGKNSGINNPSLEHVPNVGPIPQGLYTIQEPIAQHPELGPYVLRLVPHESNVMYGRSAFCIHGDRKSGLPKSASEGCIILGPMTRREIWESGDHDLRVVDI